MLGGIFVIGLLYGAIIRYFMSLNFPWMVREGVAAAFVFGVAQNGVEMSLPKILGAAMMFTIVYTLLTRFAFKSVLSWLKERSDIRQAQLS